MANWIAGAIKHPGALHRALGVAQGQPIPQDQVAKAAGSKNARLAHMARLAQTLSGINK